MKLLKRILALTTLGFLFAMLGCATVQKGGELSEQEAKALTAQLSDIWNKGDLALVDKVFAPEFIRGEVDVAPPIIDSDALKNYIAAVRTAYPDFNFQIDEIIVKGDRLIYRGTITGTNTGPFYGMPPTGKKIKVSYVSICRIVDGKFAEALIYYNDAAILKQLGYTFTPPSD